VEWEKNSATATPVLSPQVDELAEYGYSEWEPDSTPSNSGSIDFLVSFITRATKDYLEMDPTSMSKSSEYSDGHTEFQEWKTAADFLFNGAKVMSPWDVTFTDLCEILDIDEESFLSRVQEARGEDESNYWSGT